MLLERLWYDFQMEKSAMLNKNERERIEKIIELEKVFLKSKDEKKEFEEYLDIVSEVTCEREKEIFIDGVRFGANFIIEALNNKNC